MEHKWVVCGAIFWFHLIFLIAMFSTLPVSFAQENTVSATFSSQTQFAISSRNGSISFEMGGSYSNASLENGAWRFTGLSLVGSHSVLPTENGIAFSASAQNSHVTITRFDPLTVFPPQWSGTLEYTVLGVGTQTFNVYYPDNRWLNYSVQIDDAVKTENDSWTMTNDGWITVTGAISHVKITYGARSPTAFTSADRFVIPAFNSTINFESSGTYVFADLVNNSWSFQNLALNEIMLQGEPRWALGASAKDCNVTITGFVAPAGTMGNGWLNYTLVGVGTQTFNSNLDKLASFSLNYTVYIDGEKKLQNDNWTISDDDWITVTGAAANVSIASVPNIPDWYNDLPKDRGPPTTGQLLILAALTVIVIATAAVAATKVFTKRKKKI